MSQPSVPRHPRTSYLVARLDRRIQGDMMETLRPFDLSVSQYTALSLLRFQPGLSNAQLARRAYVSPQAMNEIVKNLERRALIERTPSPDHGQIKMTTLTPSGLELLEKCDGVIDHLEQEIFGRLGRDGTERLRGALEDTIGAQGS